MKKKLNLKELKIKSFITDLDKSSDGTIKGGGFTVFICSYLPNCTDNTGVPGCNDVTQIGLGCVTKETSPIICLYAGDDSEVCIQP